MTRLYVAGHTGLIGSAFVRRFGGRPAVELLTTSRAEVDLTDTQVVRRWLLKTKPDVVVIAAGRVGGILANASFPVEFLYDNLMMEANLIQGAWAAGVKRLLNFGSACMYPKHCPQPMRPESLMTGPMEPTSEPYAIAKWAGMTLCASYNREYGARFVTAIPCTLYGPGDTFDPHEAHVLSALIWKLHQARESGERRVELWGTGNARREFLYVDDLVEACEALLRRDDGSEPINIGSGQSHTIRELASLVAGVVGFDGEMTWDASKPDGALEKLLDSSRMRGLEWAPRMPLRTGIEWTYRWFLEHEAPRGKREQACASS